MARAARVLRTAGLSAVGLFVASTMFKALRAPWMADDFPEELAVKFELMPAIFSVHMITGGLALGLVPLTLWLSRWPRWHRQVARIAAANVLVAGITAYPVALIAPVTRWSAWGFAAQATVWLALLALALWHVRAGRVAQHRAAMILMAATMTGAIFFRVYLALWAIFAQGRHYALFYALDAWVAWLVPLGLAALVLKRGATGREAG